MTTPTTFPVRKKILFILVLCLSLPLGTLYGQVPVTGIAVTPDVATVTEGEVLQLTATVEPSDADDAGVIWSSDDENIATVDGTGLVTALVPGTATVMATTNDGGFTSSSIITVEAAPVPVTGIAVTPDVATVTEGEVLQLTATVEPSDADDAGVIWSSDDESVATVDGSGLVTALVPGTATVTATTNDGGFNSSSVITVEAAPVPVTGIAVTPDVATVTEGEVLQLTAAVEPSDADDAGVIWSSDDESVATVDGSGLITALVPGTATVTATTNDGGFTSSSVITVEAAPVPVTGIAVTPDVATVTEGEVLQLTATVEPSDADDAGVIWSSDDENIATVDGTGLVTALVPGTATVTATTNDGGFTSSSVITVEAAPVPVTGIAVTPDVATVTEGEVLQLTATVEPSDADDAGVIWTSDDENIATVDGTGLVTALVPGTATVMATTNDGGFDSSSVITVEAAPVPVTGIAVTPDVATVTEGEVLQLTATVEPSDADDAGVIWTSDDENIATVDGTGLVTALVPGTVTVTATTNDGGFTSSSVITVEAAPIPVTGIAVTPDAATVTEGGILQLTAAVEPSDADDAGVIWSSDDESVATVDGSGLVTALVPGTATVTATTNDGSFTSSSIITVEAAPVPVTGIAVTPDVATVTEGDILQLTAAVEPSDADDAGVIWTSDDENIATVDGSGLVTALVPGTVTVTATTNDGGFTSTSEISVLPRLDRVGSWSEPIPFGIVPVAVANLPDGRLVVWSSKYKDYFGGADGFTYTELFDPFMGPNGMPLGEKSTSTNHDMFCPGINNLPNGMILVTGGSSNAKATLYDYSTETWIATDNMNIGRGYQGSVTLSDGSVMVIGGSWSGGLAPQGEKIAELWRQETGWKVLPGLRSDILFNQNDLDFEEEGVYRADNHSWLWAAPNGKVFHAGPSEDMHWIDVAANGSFEFAGKRSNDTYSMKGTTVMFDVGKILKVGGATSYASGDAAKDNSYVIDINDENNVTVTPTVNNLQYSRTMHNSVVLPDGKVLVTGGLSTARVFTDEGARLNGELYDPETNTWSVVAGMQVPRTYHSVSILQADGRVFVGGGGLCVTCSNHLDAEIYSPGYLFDSDGNLAERPVISAPEAADYNSTIVVNGSAGIQEFSFIKMSSSTHSTNNEQRRIPLTFSGNGTYTLNVPDRNLLPPGYYMLFAIGANGTPSIAESVLVGVPTVLVEEVLVSPSYVDMQSGEIQLLEASIFPNNAEDQTVVWSSNDNSVASVDSNGVVTAVASGTAVILATSGDGRSMASANIIVDGGCTLSNVALGGMAIQSSVYGNGLASLAVDGNRVGGTPHSNSQGIADLQHTQEETSPWWQIDLGSSYFLEELLIYNRTDKLQSRLRDFHVFVSNTPFSTQESLQDLLENSNISDYYFAGSASLEETIELRTDGRFIRIQLSDNGILHMSEVEILGCIIGNSLCEGTTPVTISQSGPYLDSDDLQTLIGSPSGGTWSLASSDGTFDPSIGPGTYTVSYTYDNGEGCVQTAAENIIVKAACDGVPPIEISSFGPYLDTNQVQELTANPSGGTWSGASTDGTFDPGIGPGIYTVTYTYDNGLGCVQTESIEIKVISLDEECNLSNIAIGGTSTQSSTYGDGLASLAINGSTVGSSPNSNSSGSANLQHTLEEESPWWQVDLGSLYTLGNLKIHNRSNGFESRLNFFYVLVSPTPFPDGSGLGDLLSDGEVESYYFSGQAGPQESIPLNTEGRYVRIQLSGTGILHMAEVEVMGCPSSNDPCAGVPPIFIEAAGPYLETDGSQVLSASPPGGVWSGSSTDGTFDPAVGPGTYTVTYTYDNGSGCIKSGDYDIVVNDCLHTNVALGAFSSQSSTYNGGASPFANDGNRTGTDAQTDLQHTLEEESPWWQVDLGSLHTLGVLDVYNRSENFAYRLRNFYVLVSPTPFPDGSGLGDLLSDGEVESYYFSGQAGPQESIPLNTEGRYVRIQLSGTGILHMAEVEVMGCPSSNDPCAGVPPIFIEAAGPYLETDGSQVLSASPPGGVWSGSSTDGTFDPAVGPGTYTVTYTYDNGSGCIKSGDYDIVVNDCLHTNVALGAFSSQSSTYNGGASPFANDGNRTGTDAQTDLQHTLEEESPWWQVDLGSLHTLGVLDVYNRSENFAYRLRNFYVLVSPTPFPDGSGLGDLLSDGEVESYYFSGQAGPQESIPLNTEGRYVRIQLSGTGILHMAEVEIAGCTTSSPNTSFKASFERLDYLSGNREFDTVGLAPNPTSDKVQVVGPSKNTVSKILIYDMQGRQVKEITNIRGDSQRVVESVDVSNLVKATYVVIVFLEDGSSYSRRLIKI